ncbi:signal-transducing histidine kinase [Parvularcula bermudensis HTCC2503]|uniref:histidine kinase n=1 Tax=Parvularcula bermudensis (strain ATCC BAA-594 / HTCC2503 / KCTC 12087) TaxID=314260 RepID=E0TGE2_PARBH|nr:HAMP domain-containing sensor histidine kinase [Parvularcula bermudensis]ADM09185.1 signal-transducing histidine kinase [Parvularcula bermudensis HTCC2503]
MLIAELLARLPEDEITFLRQNLDKLVRFGCDLFNSEIGLCVLELRQRVWIVAQNGLLPQEGGAEFLPLNDQVRRFLTDEGGAYERKGIPENCDLRDTQNRSATRLLIAPLKQGGEVVGHLIFATTREDAPSYADVVDWAELMAIGVSSRLDLSRTRDVLHQQDVFIRRILDLVPTQLSRRTEEGTILWANRASAKAFGHDRGEDLEGRSLEELVPELAPLYRDDDCSAIALGEPSLNRIEPYRAANGHAGWMKTDRVPLPEPEENKSVLVVSTDITELKNREEQLKTLNNSLTSFASLASHDLRAPLRQAGMFLDILKDDLRAKSFDIEGDTLEALSGLEAGLTRMRLMVSALFKLARLDTVDFHPRAVDLNIVVANTIAQMKCTVDQDAVNIDVGQLPIIQGEETLLISLFQNLIDNACRYANQSGTNIRIYYRRDIRQLQHIIVVEDDGPGIPEHAMESVFEPLRRLTPRANGAEEGMGIGLALCRRIVNVHKGRISLDPEYSSGARFLIALPMQAG